MEQADIKDISREMLRRRLKDEGFSPFNADQIYDWVYRKRIDDFEQMTNLSKKLRQRLSESYICRHLAVNDRRISADGTEKFLFRLSDGAAIETVLIPEPERNTLCMSSQVGCKYSCAFCVSGRGGFVRNLTTAEIVDQLYLVNGLVDAEKRVTNVVFMGVGEPLDNYDNLMAAIDVIGDEKGIYLGRRKISISTCGIVPAIERLLQEDRGIRLSLSLHAADNETRSKIMPVNRRYPLEQLIPLLDRYSRRYSRSVFYEYILIKGLNASVEDARKLTRLLKGTQAKINLIPYNPSPYFDWQPPTSEDIQAFRDVLEKSGIFYTVRKPRGQDIAAACGQLRAEESD
jgi:23S rRNA (adenine2503-C2)-methyltransferase